MLLLLLLLLLLRNSLTKHVAMTSSWRDLRCPCTPFSFSLTTFEFVLFFFGVFVFFCLHSERVVDTRRYRVWLPSLVTEFGYRVVLGRLGLSASAHCDRKASTKENQKRVDEQVE